MNSVGRLGMVGAPNAGRRERMPGPSPCSDMLPYRIVFGGPALFRRLRACLARLALLAQVGAGRAVSSVGWSRVAGPFNLGGRSARACAS